MIKRIGILTSGGDAPGMNTAFWAVTKKAFREGIEVYGIFEGYKGMYENNIRKITGKDIERCYERGGTKLWSARFPEFQQEEYRQVAIENLRKNEIDAVVVIGGDGSFMGAMRLTEMGFPAIGIPGTIDNDIKGTEQTVGFATALNTVVEMIEKLKDTADSHKRAMIVEIMGRKCGDLPLHAAISSGAELLWIPEHKWTIDQLVNKATQLQDKREIIVCVAECYHDEIPELMRKLDEATVFEPKHQILGHIQRGGRPTVGDRILATRLGNRAVELLIEGKKGRMVGVQNNKVVDHDIIESITEFEPNFNEELYNTYKGIMR